MNRSNYSEPFDCAECGGEVCMFDEFDYCGVCSKPLHTGCAEFREHANGFGFVCPGCGVKENDE